MTKHPTTIRLDPLLYKKVLHEGRKAGLSFSDIVHLLLRAFVEGTVHIGVTQYPKGYLETLEKEADQLRTLRKRGKAKEYGSAKELFDDILKR